MLVRFIYAILLSSLIKDESLKETIEKMKVHENEHFDFFDKEIKKRNIRPTKFLPLWDLLAIGMGFGSTIIGKKITKADADECKKITGYSIGGVSPVALDTPPTNIFIDENLNRFKEIFAAAGHPYVVFGIDFKKLCKITKGEVNSIVE